MNNSKGREEFGIFLNNDDLLRSARESQKALHSIGNQAEIESSRIENGYKRAVKSMAALGGGVALAALGRELYSFANTFDASMKEVSTLSNTVSNDLDGFKQSVLSLTADIPVVANEVAKALYQIVSAGHDGADGLKVLEVSAKAAVGGVTDTITAADAITTMLNAYKLDASDATNISDQLFTTVRLGKTTFGELGQSIAQVAPIAASFGIETEQVLAAVATLTKSGTPTAQAMTQIRSTIVDTSKALGDGYYKTHSFQEGLNEVARRAGGSESELKKLIPSIEATVGLLGLTGINAQTAASDLSALSGSLGATEQAFTKMNNTADAQLTTLKNKMLAKFHEIGDGAVDMVSSVAKFLNGDGIFNKTALDDLIATMGVLIATMGAYKASLIVTNAVKSVGQNLLYTEQIAELQKLLLVKESDENQDLQKLVSNKKLTADQAAKIALLRSEVQAKLEVMKIGVATAKTEVVNAKATLIAQGNSLSASRVKIKGLKLERAEAIATGNTTKANSIQEKIHAELKQYSATKTAIKTQQGRLEELQLSAQTKNLALNDLQQKRNNITTIAGARAKSIMTIATKGLGRAFKGLSAAFASNPIGLLVTAVSMGISAFMMFRTETDDLADSTDNLTTKTSELISKIEDLSASKYFQNKSFQELQALYPKTLGYMTLENFKLSDKVAILKKINEEKEKGVFDKQDKDLADAKAKVVEQKGRLEGTSNTVVKNKILDNIKVAEKEVDRLQKIVSDRNAILKTASETPIEPQSIGAQIDQLDSDIVTITKKRIEIEAELTKLSKTPKDRLLNVMGIANAERQLTRINTSLGELTTKREALNNIPIPKCAKCGQSPCKCPKVETKVVSKDSAYDKEVLAQVEQNERDKTERKRQGIVDRIALVKFEHQQELDIIQKARERAKVLAKEEGKTFDSQPFDEAVSNAQYNEFIATRETYEEQMKLETEVAVASAVASKEKIDREKEQIKALRDEYESYIQAISRIDEKYNAEKAKIYSQDPTTRVKTPNAGYDQGNVENVDAAHNSALDAINIQFAGKQAVFEAWCNEIATLTLSELEKTLKRAKEELDKVDKGDSKAASLAKAKVVTAEKAIGKERSKINTGVDKRTIEEWQGLQGTLNEVSSSFQDIGDSIGGATGEMISGAGVTASSMISMIDGVLTFGETGVNTITAASTTAQVAIKTVESASVILLVISAALQVAMKIADMFTKNHELSEDAIASYESYIEVTDKLIDQQKDLISTMSGGEAVAAGQEALDLIYKQTEATKRLGIEYLASRSKREHSKGVQLNDKLSDDKDEINAAGFDWDELKGSGRMEGLFDLPAEELKRFQTELPHVWAQIDTETKGYLTSIIEDSDQIAEIGKETAEALTGISLDSVKSELADFLNDTDSTFEDVASSFEENMMNAINNVIANDMNAALEQWHANLAKAMEDGVLTEEEKNRLEAEREQIYKDAKDKQNAQYAAAGIDPNKGDDDDRSASAKKGIATASQESVDENNGRLESMQGMMFDLNESAKKQLELNMEYIPNLQHLSSMNNHLSAINENTYYCRRLERVDVNMEAMRRDMNFLRSKGFKAN